MECGEGRDCLLLSLRTPPTSCSSQHAQCLCCLLLAAPTLELLSGFIGSGLLPTALATAVCVWGSPYSGTPPLLGLPFSQCDLFLSLCNTGSVLGGNICNAPWQQKGGHDLQMCWETSSASSWGSQAFRICGGGAPPFPPSVTQAARNVLASMDPV